MTLLRNNLDKHKNVINTFYMTFIMKVPTLTNNIDEFKPIFKSWNEMSQNVSTKYMGRTVSARWRFGATFCTYTISILAIAESCHGDWLPALSNTYKNLPFLPAASRNSGHIGSYHRAGWFPALSNTYRKSAFFTGSKPEFRAQNYRNFTIAVTMVKNQL